MLAGLGTDIIEIGRIRKSIESQHFLERVFTAGEIVYCDSRGAQRAASYAARFAGKEAVLKAFGTGLRGGALTDIEILPDDLGCPQVRLLGYFSQLVQARGIDAVYISLSHAREYAVAQCVLGRNEHENITRK